MIHRKYTAKQVALVKRHYRRRPTSELAAEIRCTEQQLRALADRIGASSKRTGHPGLIALIRKKHALGWSDAEIAAAYNRRHRNRKVAREWVGEIRRDKLKLPSNANSDHFRRRVAKKTRQQLRRAGLKSMAELRVQAFRNFAERCGWPSDLRPRSVQILNVLYERGPQTRRQIAEAIGMPWKGSRHSLSSNDPEGSYLAHLQKRGLVVRLGRIVRQGGQGKNVNLYSIPAHIKRRPPHAS